MNVLVELNTSVVIPAGGNRDDGSEFSCGGAFENVSGGSYPLPYFEFAHVFSSFSFVLCTVSRKKYPRFLPGLE